MGDATQGRALFSTNQGQCARREANPNMRVVIRSSSDDDCCGMAADLQDRFSELCTDMKQDQAENVEDYFDGYDIGLHSRNFLHRVLSRIVWTNFNREIQRVNEFVRCWLANNAVAFELLTNEHTIDHIFTKHDIQEWGLGTAESALKILRQRKQLQDSTQQAMLQTQHLQMAESQRSLSSQNVSQHPFSRPFLAPESLRAALKPTLIGPQGQIFIQREQHSASVSARRGPHISASTRFGPQKDQRLVPRGAFPLLQTPVLSSRPQYGAPPMQQDPDRSQGPWQPPLPQHFIPPPLTNSNEELLRSMTSGPPFRGNFYSDPVATAWQPKLGYSKNFIAFESRGTRGPFQYERIPLSARQRGFQGINPPRGIRNPPKATSDDARADVNPGDDQPLAFDPSHTVWLPTEFPENWQARAVTRPSSRTSSFGPGTGSAWDNQNRDVTNQRKMHAFNQEYESGPTNAQEHRRRKTPPTANIPSRNATGRNARPTLDEVMEEDDARFMLLPTAKASQSIPYALDVSEDSPLNENTSYPLAQVAPSQYADPNFAVPSHATNYYSLHDLACDRSRPPLTPRANAGQQHIQQHSGSQGSHADIRQPIENDCTLYLGRIPLDSDIEKVEGLLRSCCRGFCKLSTPRLSKSIDITDDTPRFYFVFAYFDDPTSAVEAHKTLSNPEFKAFGGQNFKVDFAIQKPTPPNRARENTWRRYPPNVSPTKGPRRRTLEDERSRKSMSLGHERSASGTSGNIKRARKVTAGTDSKEPNDFKLMMKHETSKSQCQVKTLAAGSGDLDQFTPKSELQIDHFLSVPCEAPLNSVGESSKIVDTVGIKDSSMDIKLPNAEYMPQKSSESLGSVQTDGSTGGKSLSPLTKKKNNIKNKAKGGQKVVEPKSKDKQSSLDPAQYSRPAASHSGRVVDAKSATNEIYNAKTPIDGLFKNENIAANSDLRVIEEGRTQVLPNLLTVDEYRLPTTDIVEKSSFASIASSQKPELVLDMKTDIKPIALEPKALLLLEQQAPPNSKSKPTQNRNMSQPALKDCVGELRLKKLPESHSINSKPYPETSTNIPKATTPAPLGFPHSSRGSNDTRTSEPQEFSGGSTTYAPMSTTPLSSHMTDGITTAQKQTRVLTLPEKGQQSGTPSPSSGVNADTLHSKLEASRFAQVNRSTAISTDLGKVDLEQETQDLAASVGTPLQWKLGNKSVEKGTTITVTPLNNPAEAMKYGEMDNREPAIIEALSKDHKDAAVISNRRKAPQRLTIVPTPSTPATSDSRSPERRERPAIPPRSSSLSQPPTPEPVMTHRRRQRIFTPVKEENDGSIMEVSMSKDVNGQDGRISQADIPATSHHHSTSASTPSPNTKSKQKMGSKSKSKRSKTPKATPDLYTDPTTASASTPPKTLPKPETPFIVDDETASTPGRLNHHSKHENSTLLNEPSDASFDADEYYRQKDSYLEHLSKAMRGPQDSHRFSATQASSAATSVKDASHEIQADSQEDIVTVAREAGYDIASSSRHFRTNDPTLARLEELYEPKDEPNPNKDHNSEVVLDFYFRDRKSLNVSESRKRELLERSKEEIKLVRDAYAAKKTGLVARVSSPHTPEDPEGKTLINNPAPGLEETTEQLTKQQTTSLIMESLENPKITTALLMDAIESPSESSSPRLHRIDKAETLPDISPTLSKGRPDLNSLSARDKNASRFIDETPTLSETDSGELKGLPTDGAHDSHNVSTEPTHADAASNLLPQSSPGSKDGIDATEILTELTNRPRGESNVLNPFTGEKKGLELVTAYMKHQNEKELKVLKLAQHAALSDEKPVTQSETDAMGRKGRGVQKQLHQDEEGALQGVKLEENVEQAKDDRYRPDIKGKERELQCAEDVALDCESKQKGREEDEQALQDGETQKENAKVKIVSDASSRTTVQGTPSEESIKMQHEGQGGQEIEQATKAPDAQMINLDASEHFDNGSSPATIIQDPILTPPDTPLIDTASPSIGPSSAIKDDQNSVDCESGHIASTEGTKNEEAILSTRGGGGSDASKNKKNVRGKGYKSSKSDPWALPNGEAPWGERKKGMSFGS